jgi:cobyrinic acid a,c-diamide synthase
LSAPAVLVAAPASGAGKTLVTLGILRALRRRGLAVSSFKVGPDYIDPAFHHAASGRPCLNLDGWGMRFETLAALMEEAGRGAELVMGEGVMGLFDGAADGSGSTADLAATFGLPVVLVVDARGMGASAAAVVDGFRRHRDDVLVAGVLFNRVASPAHARLLAAACDGRFAIPLVGCLRREPDLALPSRHLGLVQACEHPALETFLERAADLVTGCLDLDLLLRLARPPSVTVLGPDARPLPPLGQRIAVARDAAFGFVYEATLAGWRREGAEIVCFSPLADQAPDPAADAVYLPGGYPELHLPALADCARCLGGLRAAAARGAFLFGECGGYMALGRSLVDGAGQGHAMAGLLPIVTSFARPRLQLGYRRIETLAATPLGGVGSRFRGHEFHCACEVVREGPGLFRARGADGGETALAGAVSGRVGGSFLHLIDRESVRSRTA